MLVGMSTVSAARMRFLEATWGCAAGLLALCAAGNISLKVNLLVGKKEAAQGVRGRA